VNIIIEKILADAKLAYKESVKIENDILETYLLSIIGNAQSIINKKSTFKQHANSRENNNSESSEIQKVHRKVPRWLKNPSQYNYKILTAFMTISNNNTTPISISLLEKPFFVALNKNIVLYQTKNGKFELCIIVPLRNEVRLLHCLHS